jgi:Carboxypeptidase regulatory-like domain/TonB dependent receptor
MGNVRGISKHAWVCTLIVFLLVLVPVGLLEAQAQTATISGTATDPSGAALVNARIVATNVGTNVSQSTTTDAQGRYTIPQLSVGSYRVEATLSGFQTVVHGGITLSVGAAVVVDFSLPVGQVSQTVNVEGQVSQVETQTSEVSTLVSPEQMRDLPLNGRDVEQLITLAPGVATIAPAINFVTGRMYGMMDNYSNSGSRPTGQMFLMDDTDIRDFWEHGIGSGYAGTSLGVEGIAEFQLLTNTYTAEFAGNGVVMNMVTRSGTNDFHGSAYEFFRNNALDARDVSDPLSGPPPFRRNQFGGALGGPMKKDKLFFFANYEGLRQSLSETSVPWGLPEPYVSAGNLPCGTPNTPTETAAGENAINTNLTCLGNAAAGGTTGTWANVGTGNNPIEAVPAGFFTGPAAMSQALDIIKLYGLCTTCRPVSFGTNPLTGTTYPVGFDQGGYQYVTTAPPLVVNEDYALGRVDYNIGTNDSIFARYVIDDARVLNGPQDYTTIFPEPEYTRDQYLTITERHVVSATTVNSLRFSWTRANENSLGSPNGGVLTSAQEAAVGLSYDPIDFARTAFGEPQLQDGNYAGFGPILPIGPDADRPDALVQSKFSGGDDIVWTHGAHTIKVGGLVTRVQTNNRQVAYAAGQYFLANLSMEDWMEGDPFIDFEVPPGYENSNRYFREIDVAPYIEDTWKIASRLTLNIGLRYDYGTNPVGWAGGGAPLTALVGDFLPPTGPQATIPDCSSYITGNEPTGYASCLQGVYSPVKRAFASNPNAQNWGPRIGFAYDPFADHKTSIRGGFGIFHDPVAARIYESGFIATPPATFYEGFFPCFPNPFAATCVNPAGQAGVLSLTQPFGIPGFDGITPAQFAAVDYNSPNTSPYQMQYNLNIQRELWRGTVLSVGYVGSQGRHLWMQRDINTPRCTTYPNCTTLPSTPTSLPTTTSGPFVVSTPADVSIVCPVLQPAVTTAFYSMPAQTSCYGSGLQFELPAPGDVEGVGPRINPNFGEMITEATTTTSNYNSLQVGLTRQFAHNIAGQVYYTWSHCLDDGSFATSLEEFAQLDLDAYNQKYDYGQCVFDIRQNLSANGLYSLPFKGNRFVEGWQLATIVGIHTGVPINIYNASVFDPGDVGTEWDSRANYTFAPGCNPNDILDKQSTNPTTGAVTVQWFNPACYEPQAGGYLGDIPRDSVKGPGTVGFDFSILKTTKLTEKLNMQFRAEAFNIINHFNVGAPESGINTTTPTTVGQSTLSQAPVVNPRQIQFAVKFDF